MICTISFYKGSERPRWIIFNLYIDLEKNLEFGED